MTLNTETHVKKNEDAIIYVNGEFLHKKDATVSAVIPSPRFGAIKLKGNLVKNFTESQTQNLYEFVIVTQHRFRTIILML